MRRFYLPLILIFLIGLEGAATEFLPASLLLSEWMIIPHWVLIFTLLVAIFYDLEHTYISVFYAILFGLLVDIVYTTVLGVYMFSYALVVYLVHGLMKLLHRNFFTALLMILIGVGIADIGTYIIYFFIGTSTMLWEEYMSTRLIPTLVANSIFFMIIYPLFKRKLLKWSQERYDIK